MWSTYPQSHNTVVVDQATQKQGESLTGAEIPEVALFHAGPFATCAASLLVKATSQTYHGRTQKNTDTLITMGAEQASVRWQCWDSCVMTQVQAMILFAVFLASTTTRAAEPQWETAATVTVGGLDVALSKPRLVARSAGYLWFPTMTRLSSGELFLNLSTNLDAIVANRTSTVTWSADDGVTWSEPTSIDPQGDLYTETMLRLRNGDELLLPFNLYPDGDRMRGWYQIVSGTRGERSVRFFDKSLTVSGWPRRDRSFNEELGLCGFGFNGQCVPATSGEYLATMYGHFQGEDRYSLVLVESRDGIEWKYRSLIAGADCKLTGGEGPCEAATVRLIDGRLMSVFRLASAVPYGQSFSPDDGRSWSEPVAMAEAHSVQPSIAVMGDGTLVLTGGRPGIFAWINRDGDGKDWLQVDLQSHHNECQPADAVFRPNETNTTSYTEAVPLDHHSVLVVYDHIPHGWNAIPQDSPQTNSVWVVRLSWTSK